MPDRRRDRALSAYVRSFHPDLDDDCDTGDTMADDLCRFHQTLDYRLGECERVARTADRRLDDVDRWRAAWEAKWKPLSFVLAAAGGGIVTAGIAFALSQLGG